MSTENLTLTDAIQTAVEAEMKAVTVYKDAAAKAANTAVEKLFGQLADFEQHHVDKLNELIASLQKKNKYVVYEGYSRPIAAQSEIQIAGKAAKVLEAAKVSLMDILTMAQEIEKSAGKKYAALAEQTSDKDGKAMFNQLAKEEQSHLKILTEVYWNLNDRGVWAWPGS
jgi:rubrerythrin